MACFPIEDESGKAIGVVCGRGIQPCHYCGAKTDTLCDGPPRAGSRSKTCDRPCCPAHSKHVGRDRDLCEECAAAPKQQALGL